MGVVTEFTARSMINLCGILIMGYMSQRNNLFSKQRRRAYLYAVGAVAVAIIAEALSVNFSQPYSVHRVVNVASCIIGFTLTPILPFLLVNAYRDETWQMKRVLFLPALINVVFVFLSPRYSLIFNVSAANEYARGSFFAVYVLAYLFGMAVFLIAARKAISIYQSRNRTVLLALLGFTLIGTSIQLVWPEALVSWSTITIVMILGYAYHSELLDKHDALTRLFNRRAYEEHLPELKADGRGVVVLFDADDFKLVNDQHGHQYGDQCLRTIADIIRSTYSKIGCSYRIGGDEFCVLGTCDNEEVVQEANREFVQAIEFAREKDPRMPEVSFGHARYLSTMGVDEVVKAADQQLFIYKRGQKREEKYVNE